MWYSGIHKAYGEAYGHLACRGEEQRREAGQGPPHGAQGHERRKGPPPAPEAEHGRGCPPDPDGPQRHPGTGIRSKRQRRGYTFCHYFI